MNRNSPRARFVRTLLASIGGYALTWAGIDWVTDYRAGATLVTLNLIAATVAATIALLQALHSSKPRTTWGRVLYTLGQNLAGGLGTLVLAELTPAALANFGRGLVATIAAAALASLATLSLNGSEGSP